MAILENIVIGVVAILHFGFLALEMLFWTKPLGLKTFNLTKATAESSATLAANQGLYNGFLGAGLLWGLFSGLTSVKIFFLACVILAGAFGGLTAKRSILFIQGLPALVGLILVILAR
jgi:putative membrane protein